MGFGLVALRRAVIHLVTEVTRPRRLGDSVMTYALESVEIGLDRPALSMATAWSGCSVPSAT